MLLSPDLRSVRALGLPRPFRLARFLRVRGAYRRMRRAVADSSEELALFTFFTAIMLYLAAVGIYHFEHRAQPDVHSSTPESLWWAVATLTTVGDGDIYPVTAGGAGLHRLDFAHRARDRRRAGGHPQLRLAGCAGPRSKRREEGRRGEEGMRNVGLWAAALAFAATGALAQDDPTKVGFVYVGPIGDGGWTYTHNEGRLAVEEEFGDDVETVYQESVAEGADAERVLTQMALSGADLIFTTSFGFMDATIAVAEKFPDVKFEHATGYKRAENVSTYTARFYEGRAVMGHIAGKMTTSNIVGYIASYPIPEVIRGINAAYIHAREANPDVEFRIVWVYTWFDPAKESDAAQALIEQGADVILQHTDSTAPLAAAERAGDVIGFGQASDMAEYKPEPRVSSIIDNWAPYYIDRVRAVREGTWESQDVWHGIDEGMVKIGEMTDVIPEEVRSETQDMIDRIAAGEYHPFTGPLDRQDGSTWLEEGETADDETLLGMDFYVEGLTGEIPSGG